MAVCLSFPTDFGDLLAIRQEQRIHEHQPSAQLQGCSLEKRRLRGDLMALTTM